MPLDNPPEIFKKIDGLNGEAIVLLDWDRQSPKFCNLRKYAPDGTEVWAATPHHPLEGVWTGIKLLDGHIEAYNFSGYLELIDYETGKILNRKFVK